MANKTTNEGEGMFKAVLLAQAIVIFSVFLPLGLVFMLIFFRTVIDYMLYFVLGVIGLLMLSGFLLYRWIKAKGRQAMQDIENSSLFRGRSVEVSFLRGLASIRFGQQNEQKALETTLSEPKFQLEDPETMRIRELTELAKLLEKNLITSEEYNRAKDQIFKSI